MCDHGAAPFGCQRSVRCFTLVAFLVSAASALGSENILRTRLMMNAGDMIATGNEWIALPTIRAVDGALESFNVLSMHDRGLLEVVGESELPALQPYSK